MIRHCVFIRFRDTVTPALRDSLFEEISSLTGRLPGLLAVHVGANVSPETGMDKGFADGFIVDFDGPQARDVYLADPAHQAVGAKLVAHAIEGVDGILVYDLEVPD